MFLKHKPSGNLIEVLRLHEVWDPCQTSVVGRFHAGEELQEAETFIKGNLCFPSGENLPMCWVDPQYRLSTAAIATTVITGS